MCVTMAATMTLGRLGFERMMMMTSLKAGFSILFDPHITSSPPGLLRFVPVFRSNPHTHTRDRRRHGTTPIPRNDAMISHTPTFAGGRLNVWWIPLEHQRMIREFANGGAKKNRRIALNKQIISKRWLSKKKRKGCTQNNGCVCVGRY